MVQKGIKQIMNRDLPTADEYSNCPFSEEKQLQNTNDLNVRPSIGARVPLSANFEEEGTQTDKYNSSFSYGSIDIEDEGTTTIIQRTDENVCDMDPSSRLQEANALPSSDGVQSDLHAKTRSRWDGTDESSSLSEGSESVIERISKSVSRLLKPVRKTLII